MMEHVKLSQISSKESKRNFVFSVIYFAMTALIAFTFVDTVGLFIALFASAFVYIPLIYFLVIIIIRNKKDTYDLSIKGFTTDIILITASFLGIVSQIAALGCHGLFTSLVIFAFTHMFLAIAIMITLIVFSIKHYKKKVEILKTNDKTYLKDIKNEATDIVLSMIAIASGSLIFFTFYLQGEFYDSFEPINYVWTFYGQILGVASYSTLIGRTIQKIVNKDYKFTCTNSFLSISSLTTSIVSLAVCAVIMFVKCERFAFVETAPLWSCVFAFLILNIIFIIISTIYFGIYFAKNRKSLKTE